jgi:hypothetical protein
MANKNIGSRGPRHTDEERFLSKVTIGAPDECWLWTGTTTGSHTKYGRFWDGTYRPGPVGRSHMIGAHIWAFKHFVRDPGDLHVLHTCDMGLCVNWVQHLRIAREFGVSHAQVSRIIHEKSWKPL